MSFKKVYYQVHDHVMDMMDKNLSTNLYYHSREHMEYVIKKAEYIAIKEGVSPNKIYQLKLAALFHDIGFIKQRKDHEQVGCKIMRKELTGLLSDTAIKEIEGMIMATKIPQSPSTLFEMILADVDLEYLSTKLFKSIGDLLYKELLAVDQTMNERKWKNMQIGFMEAHHYHTRYCKRYKEHRKRKNLLRLKEGV